MNKKKLSHSNLNSSITSVLAALLCIVIGMAVGFLVLLAINPAHAWGDGFVRIVKGGFHDAPYGVGKELANAAPLITTLGVNQPIKDFFTTYNGILHPDAIMGDRRASCRERVFRAV